MGHPPKIHGTTILAVRHRGGSAIAGDGQVTLGRTVMKHGARKIRRLHNGQVLAGFAGSTADALALFAKFEAKIEEYRGHLERAAGTSSLPTTAWWPWAAAAPTRWPPPGPSRASPRWTRPRWPSRPCASPP